MRFDEKRMVSTLKKLLKRSAAVKDAPRARYYVKLMKKVLKKGKVWLETEAKTMLAKVSQPATDERQRRRREQ